MSSNRPKLPPLRSDQIEALLRTLGEVEQLEAEHGYRALPAWVQALEAPAALRLPDRRRWPKWSVAAAAAAAFVFLYRVPSSQVDRGVQRAGVPVPLRVTYTADPGWLSSDDSKHCVQSTPAESCSILAVMRTWSHECQCLVWDLYRWDTGSVVARARAGESVELVTQAPVAPPSLEQVVVFAVARERDLLPHSGADSSNLLECLLDGSPAWDGPADLERYAKTVKSCLPPSVTVVPQRLNVR